jgi:pyroglutamyl-peptidase
MTGQAARRAILSVESIARNRSRAAAPDNRGVVGVPSASHGSAEVETTACAQAVARAIREAGLAARVSAKAGGYVCNHLYYGALKFLREHSPATPAVFVHLPATPEQSPRRASGRRLTTADAAIALKSALAAMVEELARAYRELRVCSGHERGWA